MCSVWLSCDRRRNGARSQSRRCSPLRPHTPDREAVRRMNREETATLHTRVREALVAPRANRRSRQEAGRDERTRVPLEAHAELGGDSHRDVLKTLRGQDEARVAEFVPIRWGRMSVSPFTFYRGAAAVMAADLAATPRSNLQ